MEYYETKSKEELIAEIRILKDTLKQSEKTDNKFKLLFDNMEQGVFCQNTDGTLQDVNDAALKLLGLSKDEFLGRTSMNPEWKVFDENGIEISGNSHPSMEALNTGKEIKNRFLSVYNPVIGDFVWMHISAKPLFKDNETKPYRTLVTLHDLTKEKRAEEKLLSVLNALPFPVAVVDTKDDKIFYWSRSAIEFFGHTAATIDEWYKIAYPDPTYRKDAFIRWKSYLSKAAETKKTG